MSPVRRCMPLRHKRLVILAYFSRVATRTRRDDALFGIRLLLLHPWVCVLYGSCLTSARPRASACSFLIVAMVHAQVVIASARRCGMAVLPAFAITSFSISSVALHVFKVMSSCTVISAHDVPISGMFVFTSPSVSLYRIFASPAVSSLTLETVISVLPTNRSRILVVACVPTRHRAWSSSLSKKQPTHALQ